MESQEYLVAAFNKLQVKNDSRGAAFLGVPRGTVSQYRTGKRIMSPEMAIKVAEILDIDPLKLIMICEKERATENKKQFWAKQIEIRFDKAATIILSISIGATLMLSPTPSQAAPALELVITHCILCKIGNALESFKKAIAAYGSFQIYSMRSGFSY